jgi:A/G-specific adenine glycosylase
MESPDNTTQIRAQLLRWYRRHARDLPWRQTHDPYAIWLSEIMLQQTQVQTVVAYYERFLKRLPTVEKLARARLDTVLKLWEGLGYYSRARNLHKAAQCVVKESQGVFPDTAEDLMRLPGIGRYTAGAIASIAFGRQEPIVDGNVKRILCRVFRLHGDTRSQEIQQQLWALAADLVPMRSPGEFNQAMMELGATLCQRQRPNCPACPLSKLCLAHEHQEQDQLPRRAPKKSVPHKIVAIGIIVHRGKVLIDKRRPEGLLGGLWEFPGGKPEVGESLEVALKREVKEELNINIKVGPHLTTVRHAYTHFTVELHAYRCRYLSGTPKCLACTDFKWISPQQLGRYAFPGANKKIFPAILKANFPINQRQKDSP